MLAQSSCCLPSISSFVPDAVYFVRYPTLNQALYSLGLQNMELDWFTQVVAACQLGI